MLARHLDVLLIASAQRTTESFRKIEEQQRPYVLVDRKFRGLSANFVGTDDVTVGRIATEHLIENGCRRIAYIGGGSVSPAVDRLQGYRIALSAANLLISDKYTIRRARGDDSGDVGGYKAAQELLALSPRPDGIFCNNDPIAMGAMGAILEANLRIPDDMQIVGAGNVRYAGALRVPLTSVDQDSQSLGARAAELALSLVQAKRAVGPKQILIQPKLVVRESSLRAHAITQSAS